MEDTDKELKDPYIEENKKIAGRIHSLIAGAHGSPFIVVEPGEPRQDARFRSKQNPGEDFSLFASYTPDDSIAMSLAAPPDFTQPFYHLVYFNQIKKHLVTSPYGSFPENIIGLDNRLYTVNNLYFFSAEGKARKLELIFEDDLLSNEEVRDRELDGAQRVSFIPQEEDSRYVDLEPGDYEKIDYLLTQAETGEFVEP